MVAYEKPLKLKEMLFLLEIYWEKTQMVRCRVS